MHTKYHLMASSVWVAFFINATRMVFILMRNLVDGLWKLQLWAQIKKFFSLTFTLFRAQKLFVIPSTEAEENKNENNNIVELDALKRYINRAYLITYSR